MYRRLSTAVLAASALLVAAPAARAAGWVTSGPLSPPGEVASTPQLAVTPSGERVIAWIQDQPNGFTPENVSIRVAPPGQDFGPTQTISAAPFALQMATAADGAVALAWAEGATRSLHVARLEPGQTTFTQAVPFTPPGNETPLDAAIAFRGGDVFVATVSEDLTGRQPNSVFVTSLAADSNVLTVDPGTGPSGALDHAENPAGQPQVFLESLHLAADATNVVVTWERSSEDLDDQHGHTAVEYAAGGDVFSMPFNADSQTSTGGFPPTMLNAVAVGGAHAYVLWTRAQATAISYQDLTGPATLHTIPSGGAFGVDDLRAAADGSGAFRVVWTTAPPNQDSSSVFSTVVEPGDAAQLSAPVTPIGIQRDIGDLAVASDGSTLVLPVRDSGGFNSGLQVFAALAAPGSAFGPLEDVSGLRDAPPNTEFEHAPSAFVGPGGRALALWSAADQTGTPNLRLFLSERDTTPPDLSNVNVPVSASIGEPVTLSATATDDLSTPTVTWDFGDGSQAQGASVTHVFGSSGAATVTVTATDSVGNTTSQTRVIAVTASNASGPGPDHVPPVISGLAASSRRFRVSRGTTAVVAASGARRGTSSSAGTIVRLRVSERATLVLTFTRRGRRQPSGTLVRISAGPGLAVVPFSGRIGGTALSPGKYVLSVVAIDGSGNRSTPVRISLTVVRGVR
jgi:hypothetical protein